MKSRRTKYSLKHLKKMNTLTLLLTEKRLLDIYADRNFRSPALARTLDQIENILNSRWYGPNFIR